MPTECDIPVGYKLRYNSVVLGDIIVSHQSVPSRVTAIHSRQNFWAATAILDGRYPSLIWEHNFKVAMEKNSLPLYMQAYFNIAATHISSDPLNLSVVNYNTPALQVYNYGNCYLEGPNQDSPESLLLTRAGIFSLKFMGTSVPSMVSTV